MQFVSYFRFKLFVVNRHDLTDADNIEQVTGAKPWYTITSANQLKTMLNPHLSESLSKQQNFSSE